MTEKRFTIIYNEQSKMMQYVDNYKEEPNKWAIWNANETAQKLNKLYDENEELKSDLKYWYIVAQSLAKGNNIGEFEMRDKEVTVDLNELDINIQKEIIFKSDLNKWIEKKMDYYEGIIEKTDGCNYVNAKGHLDMLVVLKEWIKQR